MTKRKNEKKKNRKSLNKKLLAYSMTATGVLAMTPATNAGIVHTDPPDIVVDNGNPQYDINLCTLCGPEFRIIRSTSAPMTFPSSWLSITPLGTGNNAWLDITAIPTRLTSGSSIGPPVTGINSGLLNGFFWMAFDYLGNFLDSTGYIGVRFECAGNTYYGWIHYTGDYGGGSGMIHDWAYEDVPNTPILAGDTNTAPEVDLNGGGPGNDTTGSFTEDGGPVAIAPAGTVTDAEGDTIQTVTIALTNNLDGPGVEALWLGAAANVAIGGSGTDTITLTNTGTTTNAQFTAALQAVTYDNTSDTPDTTDRAITVVANDGAEDGVVRTVTMSVIENNDPPTDITLVPADVNENSPVNTTVGTLNTTDPDG